MNVKIVKSNIPIIWLDSSIIIKIAKWKNNELKRKSDLERVPSLFKIISSLVEQKKLFVPLLTKGKKYIGMTKQHCMCFQVYHIVLNLNSG